MKKGDPTRSGMKKGDPKVALPPTSFRLSLPFNELINGIGFTAHF
jgi:hypothetical protein